MQQLSRLLSSALSAQCRPLPRINQCDVSVVSHKRKMIISRFLQHLTHIAMQHCCKEQQHSCAMLESTVTGYLSKVSSSCKITKCLSFR